MLPDYIHVGSHLQTTSHYGNEYRTGVIVSVNEEGTFRIKWDDTIRISTWYIDEVNYFKTIDPQEFERLEDQKRRLKHAMQYL